MAFSFPHLYQAYLSACKGHLKRPNVIRFCFYLERELLNLESEIAKRTYRPRKKKEFWVHDPKQRKIYESHFRDRVVHHAICNVLVPKFERRSLPVSYACRKSFGNLKALNKLRREIQRMEDSGKNPWILKVDIKKYFDSVPHERLFHLIARDADTEEMNWICERVVESHHVNPRKGLPIGNLTSQVFANLYLNELDHFLVHKLGFKRCFRFMDDIVILHDNPEDLKELLKKLQHFCRSQLDLEIHPNKIFLRPVHRGIEFLGFHVNSHRRIIKPSNMARIKRRLKRLDGRLKTGKESPQRIRRRLISWMGYAIHGQVKFQLAHLTEWAKTHLSDGMALICQSVFARPSKDQLSLKSKPQQSTEKIAHSVSYQSPLRHMRYSNQNPSFF